VIEFRSEVAKIDLIPIEEFKMVAPLEMQPTGTEEDAAHALLLKRLEFELQQRRGYPSVDLISDYNILFR